MRIDGVINLRLEKGSNKFEIPYYRIGGIRFKSWTSRYEQKIKKYKENTMVRRFIERFCDDQEMIVFKLIVVIILMVFGMTLD